MPAFADSFVLRGSRHLTRTPQADTYMPKYDGAECVFTAIKGPEAPASSLGVNAVVDLVAARRP